MILRRIHTTGMKSKVHPTYKTKYRVANWADTRLYGDRRRAGILTHAKMRRHRHRGVGLLTLRARVLDAARVSQPATGRYGGPSVDRT